MNLDLTSHKQQGHMETGQAKRGGGGAYLAISGLVV